MRRFALILLITVSTVYISSCGGGTATPAQPAPTPTAAFTGSISPFGNQRVGSTSSAQTVFFFNSSLTPLSITSVTASGDFAETNNCGSSLATGANCLISVTFTPTATGARTGTLSVADNAANSPQTLALTGTGTAPAATLSLTSLVFASQAVGTTSSAQTVTLTNSGTGPLTVTGITASGDFAETNTCGGSVAAGANCTISVKFAPTAIGARVGTLSIADDAAGSPQTVALSGTATVSTTMVSGTAAKGLPIVGALVTLKDSAGLSSAATTLADGTFTLNTTGFTPPFLIQVAAPSGSLYSVSADALTTTTINVHPFTDLIIRSWYSAQGASIGAAFANPVSMPAPAPANVQIINNAVTNLAQLWLTKAGVNTAQFNLISTPFTANGTGLDKVLGETTVNVSTGTVTITDSITTQTSTITYNINSSTMTVASTTTNASGTSVSSNTTVVPTQSAQQTALNSINATVSGFVNAVNSNGSQLTATELTPFLATDFLNDGLNQSQYAASQATDLRGGLVSSKQIQSIKILDLVNGIADIVFNITFTQGAVSQTGSFEAFFENVAGTWLFGGDKLIAQIGLQAQTRTSEGAQVGSGPFVNVGLTAPGNVTGATVTDPSGITGFNSTPLAQEATQVKTFQPTPTTQLIVNFDQFARLSNPLGSNLVPAGTLFTLAITPMSGPVVNYTLPSNVFTTESISITSPTSGALSSYTFGQPQNVTWTLPTTFAIAQVKLDVSVYTGPQSSPSTLVCYPNSNANLATIATSGTITIPATCNGQPVVQVDLQVEVTGVNGESAMATVFIQ